jgi:hypothetical protein
LGCIVKTILTFPQLETESLYNSILQTPSFNGCEPPNQQTFLPHQQNQHAVPTEHMSSVTPPQAAAACNWTASRQAAAFAAAAAAAAEALIKLLALKFDCSAGNCIFNSPNVCSQVR